MARYMICILFLLVFEQRSHAEIRSLSLPAIDPKTKANVVTDGQIMRFAYIDHEKKVVMWWRDITMPTMTEIPLRIRYEKGEVTGEGWLEFQVRPLIQMAWMDEKYLAPGYMVQGYFFYWRDVRFGKITSTHPSYLPFIPLAYFKEGDRKKIAIDPPLRFTIYRVEEKGRRVNKLVPGYYDYTWQRFFAWKGHFYEPDQLIESEKRRFIKRSYTRINSHTEAPKDAQVSLKKMLR